MESDQGNEVKLERIKPSYQKKNEIISQLYRRDIEHTRNPGLIGPSGKDGVDGRPGKPGLVNMSLCVYRVQYGVPLIF